MIKLDGKDLAQRIKLQLKEETLGLKESLGKVPG